MAVNPIDLSLYLVLDPDLCQRHSMVETTRLAVAHGATVVQLRDKHASTAEMIDIGRALMEALDGTGVPLIVNDDVEAAFAIGAHGVHVGQDDLPPRLTREKIGPDKILGLSVETEDLIRVVDPTVVDYVGIGPVFSTATKPDHKPPVGFDGLRRIVAASLVPTVAIGGLKAEHVTDTLATGAGGLAVVSAICGQPDPAAATAALARAISRWRSEEEV